MVKNCRGRRGSAPRNVSVTVFAEKAFHSMSIILAKMFPFVIFSAIKQQTGYVVFYDNDILKDASYVSLSVIMSRSLLFSLFMFAESVFEFCYWLIL